MTDVPLQQSDKRDYFFDNAKFILIVLVVISHAITPLISSHPFSRAIYLMLFSFHMPLFLFISGYFAKKAVAKREFIKPIQKLLVPYLIFQMIYTFFYYDVEGRELQFNLLEPHWSLWFLLTLFSFYFIIHLFKFHPGMLIAALILGIAIGYVTFGNVLSLTRTFVFFPFFLAGYFLQRQHFQFLYKNSIKKGSIIFLIASFLFFFTYAFDIPYELFYGNTSYQELGFEGWSAGFSRFFAYAFTIAISIAFLALVPKEKQAMSTLAKNTLFVYLLHGFLLRYLRETNFYDNINTTFEVFLLIAGSIFYTIFLSSRLVTQITKPLIEPFSYIQRKRQRDCSKI